MIKKIIYKIKRWWWCINLYTMHPYNKEINDFIYQIIELYKIGKATIYICDEYTINIKTEKNEYSLWNANKYYSWLSRCGYDLHYDNLWSGEMPTKKCMYDFKCFLKSNNIKNLKKIKLPE